MHMEISRGSEMYGLIENVSGCTIQENGCKQRKCPCRLWVNCPSYVDIRMQALRLERKEYDFSKWYRNNFRTEIQMQDSIVNG